MISNTREQLSKMPLPEWISGFTVLKSDFDTKGWPDFNRAGVDKVEVLINSPLATNGAGIMVNWKGKCLGRDRDMSLQLNLADVGYDTYPNLLIDSKPVDREVLPNLLPLDEKWAEIKSAFPAVECVLKSLTGDGGEGNNLLEKLKQTIDGKDMPYLQRAQVKAKMFS